MNWSFRTYDIIWMYKNHIKNTMLDYKIEFNKKKQEGNLLHEKAKQSTDRFTEVGNSQSTLESYLNFLYRWGKTLRSWGKEKAEVFKQRVLDKSHSNEMTKSDLGQSTKQLSQALCVTHTRSPSDKLLSSLQYYNCWLV